MSDTIKLAFGQLQESGHWFHMTAKEKGHKMHTHRQNPHEKIQTRARWMCLWTKDSLGQPDSVPDDTEGINLLAL